MFRVRKQQFAVFRTLFQRRFEAELEAHLRAELPEEHAALGEERVRELIRWAIDRGKVYGFVTEQQVCLFATATLLLGPELETAPEHRWAKQILDHPHYLYPDQRLEALFAEMARRDGDDEDGDGDGEGEDEG